VASLSTLANAETSAPDRVVAAWPGRGSEAAALTGVGLGIPEQLGIWDLAGSEVRIKIQGINQEGVELYSPKAGESVWPAAPRLAEGLDRWRDLRYVPDMQQLTGDGRIDPALVAESGSSAGALSSRVASRVRLASGRLEAGIPSQRVFRESWFDFASPGRKTRLRQAVTDTVRWSLEADAPVVTIEIAPTDGRPIRRLVLAAGDVPHQLFVSNLPSENVGVGHDHSVSEEEMAALHFGAYYELLLNQPDEKPTPRRSVRSRLEAVGLVGSTLCPPGHFGY
jgi:hypothetical protein